MSKPKGAQEHWRWEGKATGRFVDTPRYQSIVCRQELGNKTAGS